MIVHLFAGQSNYSQSWLEMFARHFSVEGHYFIFGLGSAEKRIKEYPENINKRILHCRSPFSLLFRIIPLLYRSEWIFFHSLAYDPSLFFWACNRRLLRCSTWIIWGFDLYAFQNAKVSLRTRIYESLRRVIIPFFPEVASFVEEDALLARDIYGMRADYIHILYPVPVQKELLRSGIRSEGPLNILIGNSADPGNCHCEMLEILAGWAGHDIRLYCPLSYGGSRKYVERIIKTGESIFGKKFIPLLSFLGPEEYAEVLNNTDICLMNHRRQQGLGNILSLLYLGKKVYLRNNTSSFYFFRRNNCRVFDIDEISSITFDEFAALPADIEDTRRYAAEIMSREYYINTWSNLIKRHSF